MNAPREPRRGPHAVALRHASERAPVPTVVAKGRGEIAQRILAAAAAAGVPVRSDRDLLELLAACDLGDEVPPELYRVVAELVHWAWEQNERLRAANAGGAAPEVDAAGA